LPNQSLARNLRDPTRLILRDMIFGGKRHFREMLQSEEGISSNILSNRLEMLFREGIVTRTDDPRHRQKIIYSLTEKGIVLLPVFVHIVPEAENTCP
jgi:DNA-binding HxlR family transcriptional regulator